jgi:CRP/FNR family cyclic AMP-dependent transcriptional regulator
MAELNLVEKVIALEAVELLRSLSPDQLARVASIAQEVHFPPGKVIFEAGKDVDALYVVLDGSVAVSRGGEVLAHAQQNEVIGAWALFDDEPMQVTATAAEDVRVLKISRSDFYELLSDNIEIAAGIFSTLVKRFRKLVEG